MKAMTKQDALREFRRMTEIVEHHRGDRVAKREGWNDYTDALRKDGLITQKQYQEWTNPF